MLLDRRKNLPVGLTPGSVSSRDHVFLNKFVQFPLTLCLETEEFKANGNFLSGFCSNYLHVVNDLSQALDLVDGVTHQKTDLQFDMGKTLHGICVMSGLGNFGLRMQT